MSEPIIKALWRLSRLDKPVGFWLLFFPCLWGLLLATPHFPPLGYMILFLVGAIVMRGAGCTYNDIVDRDIDRCVARTANRPLAQKSISLTIAYLWLAFQVIVGFLVLWCLPHRVMPWAIGSLALVALYPWVKRFSHWPQLVLGFAFNWGVLLGWLTVNPTLHISTGCLYLAGICWTLAYDTVYAHQDKEDDLRLGVKSTAIYFQGSSRTLVHIFYGLFWLLMLVAGLLEGLQRAYMMFIMGGAFFTFTMIKRLDLKNVTACLQAFRNSVWIGLMVTVALVLGKTALTH